MGWTFGWNGKKFLVDYLNSAQRLGAANKLVASCVRGNHHWQVIEHVASDSRFIALNLLSASDGEWGYKDLDESMGLYQLGCPLSYLTLAPEHDGMSDYTKAWRARVREYHAKRKPAAKLAVGQVWELRGTRWPITVKLTKVKPLRGYDVSNGAIYRIPRKLLGALKEAA